MKHGHKHASPNRQSTRWRLLASLILNLAITIAEVIGGIVSGSLALLSDAVHNFSDTASQGISYYAMAVSERGPDARKTFGYKRFEVVAAFFNLVTLVIVALLILKEGVERLFDPQPIDGAVMLIVAVVGLAVNVGSALLLRQDAQHSLNIRAAYLHIVSDAVSSVAVVAGGIVVVLYGFVGIDAVIAIFISVYILVQGYRMLRDTTDILMNSVPAHIDLGEVVAVMRSIEGVEDVHHVHAWMMDEHAAALEAHIVIDRTDAPEMERIKNELKSQLAEHYDLAHTTLEFEFEECETSNDGFH